MKTQKLLVIVASVCLMAFFNVVSFAQTTPVQSALAGSMAEVLAQSLAAQGYEVVLDGSSVKIATNRGELNLDLPATGEELEDSGIRARLVPPADPSTDEPAEGEDDFLQLQQCLAAVDLIYEVTITLCELNTNSAADFLCKTDALFERIMDTLKCTELYVDPPPPTGPVVSVFHTSGYFEGNLGGLAGADAECQAAAEAADLSGTDWTAWLSDSTENAIDRIPDGQYRLVDGVTQVANDKADLTSGVLKHAISMDEFGQTNAQGSAWTGTNPDGTGTGNNCNNWTDNSSEFSGDVGTTNSINDLWTYSWVSSCSQPAIFLYCFGGVE